MTKKSVDVAALVNGDADMMLCNQCGCAIIMDFATNEPMCNCNIEKAPPPQAAKSAPKLRQKSEPVQVASPEAPEAPPVASEPAPPMSAKDLLTSLPGAPNDAEIETLKASCGGKIFITPFDRDEVYIWRPIRYREWQQIQVNQHLSDEKKMQEFIVTRAVLWPKMTPELMGISRAGLIPTLSQVILHGSHFLPIEMALNMTSEL